MKKRLSFALLFMMLAGFLIASLPAPNSQFWINPAVWDDLRIPLTSVRVTGPKAPAWTAFVDGTYAWAFSNTTENEVYFVMQSSHKQKLNSPFEAHLHWVPSTTNTGSIQPCIECTKSDIGGTFGSTFTTCGICAADGTAFKQQICELGDIPGFTGVSGMMNCRLYRDVTGPDDYTAIAYFLEFDHHYQIDSNGSRQEYVK